MARQRILGVLALSTLPVTACATGAKYLSPKEACDSHLKPRVELSEYEACLVARYRQRCDESDVCMINCLVRGAGDGISGGCWHTCFAYSTWARTNPPGFHDCDGLSSQTARTERDSLCIAPLPVSTRERHGLAAAVIVLLLDPPDGLAHVIDADGCLTLDLDRKQRYELDVYADGKKIATQTLRLTRFPNGEADISMDPVSGDWQLTPAGTIRCCRRPKEGS